VSFRADSRPLAGGKRSVVMEDGSFTRDRPAPIILLKECPEASWKGVRALDDRHFAVAWGGPYISSGYGIQIRTLDGLVEQIADVQAPLARTGKYLLGGGALSGGYHASVRVLEDRKLLVELPLATPYVLSKSGLLFGYLRAHWDFQSEPVADPALSAEFPDLKRIIDTHKAVVVGCDLAGKVHFTIEDRGEVTGLVLSADEGTLFFSEQSSVGAFDLANRQLRWHKRFDQAWHRRLALSADGTRLAVGGMGPVRVFSAEGELVKELRCSGRIDALTYHGQMLMAAGNGKRLFLFDENHQARSMKVAAAGINDLAVVGGGVLIACDQRQLRFLPLLDDEA
jgi:hypothetical protein